MNDRELLEMAAKAAGISGFYSSDWGTFLVDGQDDNWEPLTNDGDALRLAVKLRLNISVQLDDKVEVSNQWESEDDFRFSWESYEDDANAATRRAIVGCAAKIGKAMP